MSWMPDFTQPPPKVQTLAEAQALIEGLWELGRQVEGLKAQVAELQEQVALSSRNSSKPPSQDGPGTFRPVLKKSGRPRGGQKGHPGHYRALVPSEQVDATVPCRPQETVCGCGQLLPLAERRCAGAIKSSNCRRSSPISRSTKGLGSLARGGGPGTRRPCRRGCRRVSSGHGCWPRSDCS